MKALVLSGGGARGAYEAGVANALIAREHFDLICGVSIGAINAALIAAGDDDALERFWNDAFPAQVLDLFPHVPHLRRAVEHVISIGGGNGWHYAMRLALAASELRFLRNLSRVHKSALPRIASALEGMVDFDHLRHSLVAGATNVSAGAAAAFHAFIDDRVPSADVRHAGSVEYRQMTRENFVLTLLASSAMPGLFSPIELAFGARSNLYADGCLIYNSPLGLAIDCGATEITVVFVDPEPPPNESAQGIAQMATAIATLWQQRLLDYEMRLAEATNEISRLGGATNKRPISIRHVRPNGPLDLDILAFDDADGIARVFARGMRDGAAAQPQHFPQTKSA